MRAPTASEVILFARVLMTYPRGSRACAARTLLSEADEAERYHQATGLVHPDLGDGSLMARSLRASPASEPMADHRDFLQSLVIAGLALMRHSRPRWPVSQL
jgi:hypothetical protein